MTTTYALIPWPSGAVRVRKAWAAKQGTFVTVLDGPADALKHLLPDRPRDPSSRRAQVTPDRVITTPIAFQRWIQTRLPMWQARLATSNLPPRNLLTLNDSRRAAEAVLGGTVRPSSLGTYKAQFNRLERYLPWDTTLISLTRESVQALVTRCTAAGESPTEVRLLLAALRRAVTPAIDAGVVAAAIFDRIAVPRSVDRSREVLTLAQRTGLLMTSHYAQLLHTCHFTRTYSDKALCLNLCHPNRATFRSRR